MENVCKVFEKLLKKRISVNNGRYPLSEDNIRYIFYAAFLDINKNVGAEHIVQELSLDSLKINDGRMQNIVITRSEKNGVQKAIDTFCDFDTKKIAIEFKFHRQYNSSQPKPMHAGQLFSDLNRLSFLNNNIEKYLVYITDEDMRNYEGELYQRLIGLDPKGKGDNFKLSEQKEESKTFRERAFKCFESETIDYNYSYVIKRIYKSIKFCEYNDNWLSIYVFKIE